MGIRDFISVIREMSFDELEAESRVPPRLLVISSAYSQARRVADALFGDGVEEYVDVRAFEDSKVDPLHYDVIISVGPLDPKTGREWRDLYRRVKEPWRMVEMAPMKQDDKLDVEPLRRRVADCADDRSIAIGRYVPAMKGACAHRAIVETSTVNAQFALVSNIPTLIPLVGNVLAVGADFIVLTKNQLMLIFKLAAINGRDLDSRWRIYSEMIPVVGAGLAWRTVAREVVTLLPLAIGTVPKVAIAFAGTWAIGEAAQVYYERGEKLNREQMRALYSQALDVLKQNPIKLPRRSVPRLSPPRLKSLRWWRADGESQEEFPETEEANPA